MHGGSGAVVRRRGSRDGRRSRHRARRRCEEDDGRAEEVAAEQPASIFLASIGVSRGLNVAMFDLGNVFLYDLDDLRAAAAANLEQREENVPAAREIIAAEAQKYWDWVAGLAAVPVVKEFREEMDKLRRAELATALRRLGPLSREQAESIEHLSKSLMNKFLHEPSVRLRAAAANGRGLGVVDAARYLFALEGKGIDDVAKGEPSDIA